MCQALLQEPWRGSRVTEGDKQWLKNSVWSGLRWSVRPKALWELQGWGRECARWTLSSAGRSLGKGLEVQVELSHSGQHSHLRSSTCRESRIRGRAEAGESVTHKESGPG